MTASTLQSIPPIGARCIRKGPRARSGLSIRSPIPTRRAGPRRATSSTSRRRTGKDPAAPDAAQALRFNWSTPFIISPHDPKVVYYGANYLLKSTDKGVTWQIVSRDLSKNDPAKSKKGTGGLTPDDTGAEGFATIFSISESPIAKGSIWAGTDDGNVWVTRDGGANWTEVDATIPDVPKGLWVSRVVASAADANTAYVSFDGHRSDNRAAWLFSTTDGGKTWTNLSGGLAPNHRSTSSRRTRRTPTCCS